MVREDLGTDNYVISAKAAVRGLSRFMNCLFCEFCAREVCDFLGK